MHCYETHVMNSDKRESQNIWHFPGNRVSLFFSVFFYEGYMEYNCAETPRDRHQNVLAAFGVWVAIFTRLVAPFTSP